MKPVCNTYFYIPLEKLLSLSLSLSLSGTNSQSHLIRNRGHLRANIRLSLERTKGGPLVFYPYPTVTVGTATDTRTTNIIIHKLNFKTIDNET